MNTLADYETRRGNLRKRSQFLAAGAAAGHSQLPASGHMAGMNRVGHGVSIARRVRAAAVRLLRRVGVGVARVVRHIEQSRRARANYEALSRLDSATLRDLGLTRSEIASAAAESGGLATATRRRIDVEFWQSASSGFRVRRVEMFLSVAVFATFAAVVFAALKVPEILVAWRATVVFA